MAALFSANSFAAIALSGEYTGTLNDSGVYTQDLATTLVGSSAAGAVTVTLDETMAVDDLYVESTLAGVKFKLGDWSGTSADFSKLNASTTVGPATVGVTQVSGGSTTFDAGMTIAGVKVNVENVTNTARSTTASAKVLVSQSGNFAQTPFFCSDTVLLLNSLGKTNAQQNARAEFNILFR